MGVFCGYKSRPTPNLEVWEDISDTDYEIVFKQLLGWVLEAYPPRVDWYFLLKLLSIMNHFSNNIGQVSHLIL